MIENPVDTVLILAIASCVLTTFLVGGCLFFMTCRLLVHVERQRTSDALQYERILEKALSGRSQELQARLVGPHSYERLTVQDESSGVNVAPVSDFPLPPFGEELQGTNDGSS